MKRGSPSLVMREMQIETAVRYHLTPIRLATSKEEEKEKQKITTVGKGVEKLEPWCTDGGNRKWCNFNGKQYDSSSKN